MKITDLPIAYSEDISESGPPRSCTRCGETWFRVERQITMPAQGWLTTAPGCEPEASAVRTVLYCTDCGDVAERQLLGDHVSQEKSRLRG